MSRREALLIHVLAPGLGPARPRRRRKKQRLLSFLEPQRRRNSRNACSKNRWSRGIPCSFERPHQRKRVRPCTSMTTDVSKVLEHCSRLYCRQLPGSKAPSARRGPVRLHTAVMHRCGVYLPAQRLDREGSTDVSCGDRFSRDLVASGLGTAGFTLSQTSEVEEDVRDLLRPRPPQRPVDCSDHGVGRGRSPGFCPLRRPSNGRGNLRIMRLTQRRSSPT